MNESLTPSEPNNQRVVPPSRLRAKRRERTERLNDPRLRRSLRHARREPLVTDDEAGTIVKLKMAKEKLQKSKNERAAVKEALTGVPANPEDDAFDEWDEEEEDWEDLDDDEWDDEPPTLWQRIKRGLHRWFT